MNKWMIWGFSHIFGSTPILKPRPSELAGCFIVTSHRSHWMKKITWREVESKLWMKATSVRCMSWHDLHPKIPWLPNLNPFTYNASFKKLLSAIKARAPNVWRYLGSKTQSTGNQEIGCNNQCGTPTPTAPFQLPPSPELRILRLVSCNNKFFKATNSFCSSTALMKFSQLRWRPQLSDWLGGEAEAWSVR